MLRLKQMLSQFLLVRLVKEEKKTLLLQAWEKSARESKNQNWKQKGMGPTSDLMGEKSQTSTTILKKTNEND